MPSPPSASTVATRSSTSTSQAATRNPSLCSRCTIAAPCPRAAPVTSATRSARRHWRLLEVLGRAATQRLGLRRQSDHPKTHVGHDLSDLPCSGVDARDQPRRRGCGLNTCHRVADGGLGPCFGKGVSHRDRQIGRPDVHARQPVDRADVVERQKPLRGLNHYEHAGPCFQRGWVGAEAGTQRPEAAHPCRGVPGGGDRGGRLFGRFDHRDDNGVGARVEHPADWSGVGSRAAAPRWRWERAQADAAAARRRRRRDSRAGRRTRRSRSRPWRTPPGR